MAKKARRKFADRVKRTVVRRIANGSSIVAEAHRLDVSRTVVDTWTKDPRYQSETPRASALPMKSATARPGRGKAKALVPTGFACPHCGGKIEVAA